MSEVVILPEMLDAGSEQLAECRSRGCSDNDTVLQVYLAMEGIREIALLRWAQESIH